MHKIEHELFKEMVLSASVHVHRQQLAGKRKQDRSDAVDWIERYGEAVARLKLSEATLTYEEALEFGEQLSTELSELRMKVSALGISEVKK